MAKAKTTAKTVKTTKTTKKTAKKGKFVTFKVTTIGKERVFLPVNKYAQGVDAVVNGALAPKHLKALKKLGFRVVYSDTLKPIAL